MSFIKKCEKCGKNKVVQIQHNRHDGTKSYICEDCVGKITGKREKDKTYQDHVIDMVMTRKEIEDD